MRFLQKINRRKSVFITILISYVAILLFPVSIGAFLYQRIETTMVNNAINTNLGLLEQVKLVAENRFNEIDKMSTQLALNPKLQWALAGIDDNYAKNQFNFLDIINHIKNVRNISSFVGNIFVYFKNSESVITSTGKSDASMFFKENLVYDRTGLDQIIKQTFTGRFSKTFLPATTIKEGGKLSNMITYVQSLPLGEKTNIKGYLVVLIKEQEFDRLIKQIEKVSGSSIYIVDEHHQVILSTAHNHEPNPKLLSAIKNENGFKSEQINGEPTIFSYTTGQNDWKYISVMPKHMVLKQVITVKNWALFMLFLCLVAGIVFAYFLAYRNYNPIRDVVRTIMKENDQTSRDADNEFDFIKQSILHSMEEKNELKQTLTQQAPVIQANFLSRLVKGNVEISTINSDTFKFMGISFVHHYFSVIMIEIDDCFDFIREDTEREWALVRFVLSNLCKDLLWSPGYVIEMDRNQLAVLINTAEPAETTYTQRNEFVKTLKNVAQQRFHLKISIAGSLFHPGIEGIGRCYREALMALEYRMVYDFNEGIYYEQIVNLEQRYYQFPLEAEVQLMNYAKCGDYTNAEALLEQIYETNFKSGAISPDMGKCLFYDLLSTLIKVMNGLKVSDQRELEGFADPVKYISGSASAEEMLAKMKALYRNICNYVKEEKTEHRDRLYSRVCRYIDERFADSNLSLASMADHFQITAQYLSTFFKNHSRQNISDYIAAVRIKEAKKMLSGSSLTMAKIAHQIGYANAVGFVRFFKKYEGISPGKYREALDQSGDK